MFHVLCGTDRDVKKIVSRFTMVLIICLEEKTKIHTRHENKQSVRY